ncbi:MAG: threonine/serine exporter family protein [Propionibacteriaceae bacterium]|nr:threonine/serine exporter family protein [Propionibacteriaceae bacterium]
MGRWQAQHDWVNRIDRATRHRPDADPSTGTHPIDAKTASAVVDLALRVSELALRCGASAADVTAFALTVAEAYRLPIDVDVTWTSITISYHRSGTSEPITGFRSVRERSNDYQMLARLALFVDAVAAGKIPLASAQEKFSVLKVSGRPYRGWVVAVANGVLSGGVAAMLGGGSQEIGLAAFSMVLVFLAQSAFVKLGVAAFYQQIVGAAVPTAIGLGVMQFREEVAWLNGVSSSIIVAAGMVGLLAGLGVVTAARDALEGSFITSAARTYDSIMSTGGIVVGVVVTLWAGVRLGVQGTISPTAGVVEPALWQAVVAGACSVAFAVICHVSPRSLLGCGLLGTIGYGSYLAVSPSFAYYPAAAAFGALAVGAGAQLVAWRWRVPVLALITTGIVALMPGMMLYRGLYYVINSGAPMVATQLLLDAILTGVGLAAGSMLGSQLVRPLVVPARWRWRVSDE